MRHKLTSQKPKVVRNSKQSAEITAMATGNRIAEAESPLVDDVVLGSVDFKGRPSVRSKSGCWKSASFIIGVEMAERFAYYGISSNLVTYLTGPLGQSTAAAAANVNMWAGTAALSPLLGAFLADSFLGRYRMIIVASLFCILGLGLLSLSAAFSSSGCRDIGVNSLSCSPPQLQIVFFFFSLYLVALAQGGHRPCVQAFGADQFNDDDQEECKAKSSFFNWWNFCLSISVLVVLFVLSYIQDNLSWELGFGIPCIAMCFALIIFLFGSMTYRFGINRYKRNPLKISVEDRDSTSLPLEGAHNRFLDEALLEPNNDIKHTKTVLRLLPICFACLPYAIVYSQSSTLFVKQGATMDRYITTTFQIPSATLQSFTPASIVLFIPLYDRVLVPVARSITQMPSGISTLQRVATGIFFCIVSIGIAALIEKKRLAIAFENGLVDFPNATVPMSVWWLAPQYLVLGVADALSLVGLQEFLYDQVPSGFKSIGISMFLGIFGVGSFLSSFLISVIEKVTSYGHGEYDSWFSNNLNRAHLDYFYWLLAGINVVSLALYVYFAKSYAYNARISV